jgi:hypothetical protein
MKKLFTLIVAIAFGINALSQVPEKMSYQAVVRNASGELVKSSSIGMRISILQGSATGTTVYVETQTPTANVNGLVTVEIGSGTATTGTFAGINWSSGVYYLKTEIDPTGGTSYTITGTSQLLSVPYALYAKTANVHYIGESYGGGIVFYIYDNGRHGLIAATADQSTGKRWYAGTYTNTMAFADGVGAGKANTAIIIANQGYGNGATYAARICNEYSVTVGGVTYGDWYLPSKYELNLLYLQKTVVGVFANDYYWSSTEDNITNAWSQYFTLGDQSNGVKAYPGSVRAIRAF